MKKFKRLILAAITGSLLSVTAAHADLLSVSVEGLINTSEISNYGNNVYSSGMAFGGGVFGELAIGGGFGLELGAMYAPRNVAISPTSLVINDQGGTAIVNQNLVFKAIELPLLVRYVGLPFLNFGFGGYYAPFIGSLSTNTNNQAVLANSSSTYSSANRTAYDFGLEAAVQGQFPIPAAGLALPMSVVVDVRYLLGLANEDASGVSSVHFRDIEMLVGVNFSIL